MTTTEVGPIFTRLTSLKMKMNDFLIRHNQTLNQLFTAAKAFGYVAGTTIAILVCVSNSLTGMAKTIWRDVGNNWEVVWGFLEEHLSHSFLFIAGSMILHMVVFWLYGLLLIYFDLSEKNTAITNYKIQPTKNRPLPLHSLGKTVRLVLFNQIFVGTPITIVMYFLMIWRGISMTLPLPSFNRFVFELALCVLIEEVGFYYTHRLFHSKLFYGRYHKIHHEWTAPIGVASLYAHPLEHLLSNLLPIYLGPFILGTHLATMWVWQTLATVTTINTHSGYHLPFMPSPEAHDFHHLSFNQITDKVFRESYQYKQHRTFFSLDYVYRPAISYKTQFNPTESILSNPETSLPSNKKSIEFKTSNDNPLSNCQEEKYDVD